MKSFNHVSRVPFAVSLLMIFAYGTLHAVVPPSVFGTQALEAPLVATPENDLPAIEFVNQSDQADASDRDARQSIQ